MDETRQVATSLLRTGRGIFVADEYVGEMLPPAGARPPARTLAEYVDLVVATPGVDDWLSGVLTTADAFAVSEHRLTVQQHADPPPAVQLGVRLGIDLARPRPGDGSADEDEEVRRQLAAHRQAGATFTEWRANLEPASVERGASHVEAEALARGAAASQAEHILPLVTIAMPDLASHSAAVTQAVTGNALDELFTQLARFEVDTSAMLLRINMVVAGDDHNVVQASPEDVAQATLALISKSVPDDVPGVVFLSGGQRLDQACSNLAAISSLARQLGYPWSLSFAYARALVPRSVESRREVDDATVQREFLEFCRQASQSLSSPSAASSARDSA